MSRDSAFSWFNLNDYKRFNDLSVREWADEIMKRESLYKQITEGKARITEINIYINRLRSKADYSIDLFENEDKKTTINSLSCWDIWVILYFYKSTLKKYWVTCKTFYNRFKNAPKPDFYSFAPAAFDGVDEVIGDNCYRRIGVDLNATDEQLIADFKEWLKDARQRQKTTLQKKLFTRKDFKRWVELQLIPCIDLILISQIKGVKLTNARIAHLIYPAKLHNGDIDLTDRVRRTARPAALELITNNFSFALHRQAAREEEQKKRHKIN